MYYYILTNFYLGLARGPIDHQSSSVINALSHDAIEMGSAVKLETAPSDQLLPRINETEAASDISYGIAVGGDTDGIYSTTGAASGDASTQATSSTGEGVVVVTQGRCLARVDGGSTAIVIGDALGPSGSNGVLEKSDAVTDYIIARALQPSSAADDIIAVDVQREGLFT